MKKYRGIEINIVTLIEEEIITGSPSVDANETGFAWQEILITDIWE